MRVRALLRAPALAVAAFVLSDARPDALPQAGPSAPEAFRPSAGPQPAPPPSLRRLQSGRTPTPGTDAYEAFVLGIVKSTQSSDIEPPSNESEDPPTEVFVIDRGQGLDLGCVFNNQSPIIIDVPMPRYVGPTDSMGFLENPTELNSRHVVSRCMTLVMPAYDVDFAPSGGEVEPERNRVLFNGHDLGFLQGENNEWTLTTFEVPIERVKFPSSPGSGGNPPAPAMNEIRIEIDVLNPEPEWCMGTDWVAMSIDVMAPLLLVHGTNAQSDSWEPEVTGYLAGKDIPYSNDINLVANGSIAGNGQLLSQRVAELAAQFGTTRANLLGHSKGGLDSRQFLAAHYDPSVAQVLSLYTLGTPHHGTILSTISVAANTHEDPQSNDETLDEYIDQAGWLNTVGAGPQQPALGNQTIAAMAEFNSSNTLPAGIRYYTLAGDADTNGDMEISNAEADPLLPAALNFSWDSGTVMYKVLGSIADITVMEMTSFFGVNHYTIIDPIATSQFQLNDLVVTLASAQHPAFVHLVTADNNHSNIKNEDHTQTILDRIQLDYPVH